MHHDIISSVSLPVELQEIGWFFKGETVPSPVCQTCQLLEKSERSKGASIIVRYAELATILASIDPRSCATGRYVPRRDHSFLCLG